MRDNQDIPYKHFKGSTGWSSDMKQFIPFVMNEDDYIDKHQFAHYVSRGSLETWILEMKAFRKNLCFRAVMAAHVSSAILNILPVRDAFFFHLFSSSSARGKTAGLMCAGSFFGNPLEIVRKFDSTATSLERMSVTNNNLGVIIDELQQLDNQKKELFLNTIYSLCSGKSRSRSNTKLESLAQETWRLTYLTSGEQPINTSSSLAGLTSRMVECNGVPFECDSDAKRGWEVSQSHYGHAGKVLIPWLISNQETVISMYADIVSEIDNNVLMINKEHKYIISTIICTEHIINKLFFRDTKITVNEFVKEVLSYENAKPDLSSRIIEVIGETIASNLNRVAKSIYDLERIQSPIALTENQECFLFPKCIEEIAKVMGVSKQTVITAMNNSNATKSVVKRIRNMSVRMYEFNPKRGVKPF
jgi:uncharacterized protein (DUF927 family)